MVRKYSIVRLHEGEATIIKGTYNEETHEFTFETEQFSTYAIAYADSLAEFTVTFDANGGSVTLATVATSSQKLSTFPTPSRDGSQLRLLERYF